MQLDFRGWRERVTAAAGVISRRIRYTRKSTESKERQVASHEQQAAAADKKWGEIEAVWWWRDSCSGTTFDRPGYQDMLAFCRANKRPRSQPGIIEIYDASRFARVLDEDGKPDLLAFHNAFNEFETLGWPLHFVSRERTGNVLVDAMMLMLDAHNSAAYSEKLSSDVTRGRREHTRAGWWTAGGAPWGTKRLDTRTWRILAKRELATPGGGGVVLIPDEEALEIWSHAAKRLLGGASLDEIGRELYEEKGILGPRLGKLGHSTISKLLTQRALIGRVEWLEQVDAQGVAGPQSPERVRVEGPAKWPPMVDLETFRLVEARLGPRIRRTDGQLKDRRRKKRALYPLAPACAHCGAEYNGGRLKQEQGAARQYTHANPKQRAHPEAHARKVAAGCRVWNVNAAELETKVKDLIVQQRSSQEFEDEVRELILQHDDFRKRATGAVEKARRTLKRREDGYARLRHMAAAMAEEEGDDPEAEDADMVAQLKGAKAAIKVARADLDQAERLAASRESAWERLSAIIHETRNLAAAWDRLDLESRKVLFDYWVLDLLIVVEPLPGRRRANHKTAVVTLRTTPNALLAFELGGDQPPAVTSEARSSASTPASDSSDTRARSEATASGEPILPSAQAACERTSGSSSESAAASADTSSADPTLPNTTAALRRSPRSFARFMGEPLNQDVNSSGEVDSSESASDLASRSASAARGENGESSDSSRANLRLNGHTSWHTSHP